MGEILSIDNGERRERFNERIREIIFEEKISKTSNWKLIIFLIIMSWFAAYGVWNFILDLISFVN